MLYFVLRGYKVIKEVKSAHLSDTMFPSSAGKLRILLEDRSRYTRLWSLAMSEGMRDRELSLRCKAVKWVSDHKDELKLLTFPVREKKKMGKGLYSVLYNLVPGLSNIYMFQWVIIYHTKKNCEEGFNRRKLRLGYKFSLAN